MYYAFNKKRILENHRLKYQANIVEEREKRRQYRIMVQIRKQEFPLEAKRLRVLANAARRRSYIKCHDEIRQKAWEKYHSPEEVEYRLKHGDAIRARKRIQYAERQKKKKG